MKRIWLSLLLILTIGAGFLAYNTPALSHGSWERTVIRLDDSRPVPGVDGICGRNEYINSPPWYPILYPSPYSWTSVKAGLLYTSTDLYICLSGMVDRLPREGLVALQFDVDHDGGRVTDGDDIMLTIDHEGTIAAYRGDGSGGFVPAPEITGWEARTDPTLEFTWEAEYRIPLSLIGGGEPSTRVGFHLRDNLLSNDYGWPPIASWNVPNTWGDLVWGHPPTTSLVRLDLQRITQGLEYDVPGLTTYHLIAGKDTLVRAQLYTLGPLRNVTNAECLIQRIRPLVGPAQTVPVSFAPTPRLNPYPHGYFNGSPVFNCWVPGSILADPGFYSFSLRVWLEGSTTPQTINLDRKYFQPTDDLRLFFWPWVNSRSDAANPSRSWGDDLTSALGVAMMEFQRMYPLRAGVGPINTGFSSRSTAGLRYILNPGVGSCDDSTSDCEHIRAQSNDALLRINASLRQLELVMGVPLDRLDWGSRLEAVIKNKTPWWGSSCPGGERLAGIFFDGSNDMGSVIGHEIGHCMGHVSSASPHWNGSRPPSHSRNSTIPTRRGLPVVNMLTQMNIINASSMMFGSVGCSPCTFTEGWEWNELHNGLVRMPRPATSVAWATAATSVTDGVAGSGPLFHLVGVIDRADDVTVLYSARIDELPLELTPDATASPYELVLLDTTGVLLGGVHFEPDFEDPDVELERTGIVLTTPLPSGTARVEIRKGSEILYAQNLSTEPPAVSNVVAMDSGQGGIDLQWDASDPDSSELTYNVFFLQGADEIPLLIASGLTDNNYFFQTDLAPATTDGRLIVEASDGFNTAQATSNRFTIANKPPVATIASPSQDTELVAGQPSTLVGIGYDYTTGLLIGNALSWSSDLDGPLGTGEQLGVSFSAGEHTLTLVATAPSGLSTSTSVQVTVLKDSDGDGLPDSYEKWYSCLSVFTFDSDSDPDGDTLVSLGEQMHGTDPCQADSDSDGMGDGDEVRLGGDALDDQSLPAPDLLYFSTDAVDLGSCLMPSARTIAVQTASSDVEWDIAADTDWITANGGGVGDGQITITANCQGLSPDKHTGQVLIGANGGQLRVVEVSVTGLFSLYLPLIEK